MCYGFNVHVSRKLQSVPVWDAHWPTRALLKEANDKPRVFARGFRQKAFSDDERMFPSFESCYSYGVALGNIQRSGWPTFMGVDLAGDKRPGNVIFVGMIDPSSQRRFPVEILCGAWRSPETARQVGLMHAKYPNTRAICVENNAYQGALIDWIRNSPGDHSYWYKIQPFTTGANKVDANIGLPSLEIEFRNKAWVIPANEFEGHPPMCSCGWCTWTGEMKIYPNSATTDTVMGCWFFREAVSKWGGAATINLGAGFNAR
jgi:hypothetical protein